jgi:hypothetical protein
MLDPKITKISATFSWRDEKSWKMIKSNEEACLY